MAKQVAQANSKVPMRTTKVEGACFGSMRSWVRVPPPRPTGSAGGQFWIHRVHLLWCCLGPAGSPKGLLTAEASAAPGHDYRSKCSVTTARAGQGSHRYPGAVLRRAVAVREGP